MPLRVALNVSDQEIRHQCLSLLQAQGLISVQPIPEGVPLMDALRHQHRDLLILSLDNQPDEEVRYLIGLVVNSFSDTRVLLLVPEASEETVLEALTVGARGYLTYGQIDEFLTKAVEKVCEGEAWVPRKMVSRILDRLVEFSDLKGSSAVFVR